MALRGPRERDPAADAEDKALTLAFQSGDRNAFDAIHERYRTKVEHLCRRMLMQPDDAREASQETFLRVYQALPRFNGSYQLGAWITRIATNVCLDQLRSRSKTGSCMPVDEETLPEKDVLATDSDPEGILIRRQDGRRVRRTLNALPPLHRAAIVLRDFEGLSYQEIAAAMEMTESQVKALLHRARSGFKRSWSSVASALFPGRLAQRWRVLDATPKEPVVQSLVSNSAPLASSCAAALSNCGGYLAERFVPVVAAAVIGAAAVGQPGPAPAELNRAELGESGERSMIAAYERPSPAKDAGGTPHPPRSSSPDETSAKATAPAPADDGSEPAAPEDPPPAADPTPAPPAAEPTPAPASESADGSEGPVYGDGSDGGQPAPRPFTASFWFERGGAPASSEPTESRTSLDCQTQTLSQELRLPLWDGSTAYPASLTLDASSADMEARFWTDDESIFLDGRIEEAVWSLGSGDDRVELSGVFRIYGSATQRGLPSRGTFSSVIQLHCAAGRLLSETVVLRADA